MNGVALNPPDISTPLAGASATEIQVVVPEGTPTGPAPFQAVNDPRTGNVLSSLGGLNGDGTPKTPPTIVDSEQFAPQKPAGAVAGTPFVQALKPPFIPCSSSASDPDGAFTMP